MPGSNGNWLFGSPGRSSTTTNARDKRNENGTDDGHYVAGGIVESDMPRRTASGLRGGRWWTIAAGLAVAALVVSCSNRRTLDAGPMLQDVRTNSVRILWWQKRVDSGRVLLRGPDGEMRAIPAHRDGFRFEALLTDLQPSTAYNYWVEGGASAKGTPQHPGRFRTAPSPGALFSFLVFGDSGSGKRPQYRLAEVMNRHPADLVLHTGDLVYRKGELRDYPKKFFRPYRHLLASAPFYPVLGNHDIRTGNGQPFLETFCLPTNGPAGIPAERCYWFEYGDARFVGIDSNLDTQTLANAVAPWLRQVLNSSSLTWKFVFFHHAPWAGGSRPSDAGIRDILVPAIEAGGADVVFCGHNHLYERTHPLRAGEVSPTHGILYVTSGAGGKTLHEETHGGESHLAVFNDSKFSFTRVSIKGPRLELSQVSEDDKILDTVTLAKPPPRSQRKP